jgi:hypothetical protein
MKKNEAVLVSYKLLIDTKGRVITERSLSDIDQIEEKFNPIIFHTLKTTIKLAQVEFDKIHNMIEDNLNARIQ